MIFAYDLLYHLVLVENNPHLRSSINITEYNYMYVSLFILLKKLIFKKNCFY